MLITLLFKLQEIENTTMACLMFGLAVRGVLSCFELLVYLFTCFWLQVTDNLIPTDSSNKGIYLPLIRKPKHKNETKQKQRL